MIKKILIVVLVLGVFVTFGSILHKKTILLNYNQPEIVTTLFPYYEIVREVQGNDKNIVLIRPGENPMNYKPNQEDIVVLENAKYLVFSGGIDLEVIKQTTNLKNQNLKKFEMISFIPQTQLLKNNNLSPDYESIDPYIWMSPKKLSTITSKLADNLPNSSRKNDVIAQFDQLDKKYSSLDNCPKNKILISNDSMNYLAKDYRLQIESLTKNDTNKELTDEELSKKIEYIEQNSYKYILIDPAQDNKNIDKIIKETGLQTLNFSTMEQLKPQNQTLFDILERNYITLKTSLECN
jgi:zinc transport system substrate-binding protein